MNSLPRHVLSVSSQYIVPQNASWSENRVDGIKGARDQKTRVETDVEYRETSAFDWARVCMIGDESTNDGTQGAEIPISSVGSPPTKSSVPSQVSVVV